MAIEYYGQNSLMLYDGNYVTRQVEYRIGDIRNTTVVSDIQEIFFDTWKTFHLVPAERPSVVLPKPNVKLVSIPGKKDPLDFSKYLTGDITYSNRTGSWSFFVDNDYTSRYNGGWVAFYDDLKSKIHGRYFKVVLREDPGYFYYGKLTLGQWNTGADRSSISISYDFYPFKKEMICSLELWKFDDFDFEDGLIQYLKDIVVDNDENNPLIVPVYGSKERVSPHISASNADIFIAKKTGVDQNGRDIFTSFGNVPTEPIGNNDSIIPRFFIEDGENALRFIGQGTVTIDYRRGML